jgi:hypothetical protein
MKLSKGTLILIDGQVCQLTGKPQRAIDGTYLIFYRTEVGGKVTKTYATEQELTEFVASK